MGARDSAGAPDYLVEYLNIDSEKAARAVREKELEALNYSLLRLFLLTEVSLGLAALFLKRDEIGGQSFFKTAVSEHRPGISWDFTLNLHCGESNMPHAVLNTFAVRGWSYSFSIIFRSSNKEIKFDLSKDDLGGRFQSPAWIMFKELYLESSGVFYGQVLHALYELYNLVRHFFEKKVLAFQMREGLGAGFQRILEINADTIVNLIMAAKDTWALFQKHQNVSRAYGQLVSETCQSLRDTKGFVKSKKLAEIRENLERKSKEISASVNA